MLSLASIKLAITSFCILVNICRIFNNIQDNFVKLVNLVPFHREMRKEGKQSKLSYLNLLNINIYILVIYGTMYYLLSPFSLVRTNEFDEFNELYLQVIDFIDFTKIEAYEVVTNLIQMLDAVV